MTGARVAILMYHSVSASSTRAWRKLTVTPSELDEQLAGLREAGVRLVTADAVPSVLAAPGDGRLTVALTVDDGLADAATGALPVLAHHGAPATLFIPSGWVGRTAGWLPGEDSGRAMLSWSAVAELAEAGMEIGSHGDLHLACDVNSLELIERDAARSRLELEDRIGRPVRSFGYPFGYGPPSARAAIRRAGFAQACVIAGLPAQAGDDRFALPRLHVGPGTSAEALLTRVKHRPTPPARAWAHAKQRAWTAGRRHAGWGPPEAAAVGIAGASS